MFCRTIWFSALCILKGIKYGSLFTDSVNDSRHNDSEHINVALSLLCFLMIYRQALFRSTDLGAIPARVCAVGVNSSRLALMSLRFTSYQWLSTGGPSEVWFLAESVIFVVAARCREIWGPAVLCVCVISFFVREWVMTKTEHYPPFNVQVSHCLVFQSYAFYIGS